MSTPPASRWITVFQDFAADIRIKSKEEIAEDDRGIPLVMWDSQRRFLTNVGQGLDLGIRKFYNLKSRQLGITTLSLALVDVFWPAMHKNILGALVTDTEGNRDANRRIIKSYVESFPEGYFGDEFYITKDNRNFLEFSNGSRLNFLVAGTKKKSLAWAEGQGYTFAHVTEVGKFGDPDALKSFEESLAQNNPNRLFVYESTANGFNHWRVMYQEAKADQFTKRAWFTGWWSGDHNRIEQGDPRFMRYGLGSPSGEEREKVAAVAHLYGHRITPEQLAWRRWRDATATNDAEAMLLQNQPWTEEDAWVVSGFSFFQVRSIARQMKELLDTPPATVAEGGYGFAGYRYDLESSFFDMKLRFEEDDIDEVVLRVWEEPVPDGRYVIGFDPAWGRNEHKDRSAISVWRCFADKLVQVAEYADADVELKRATWVCAHLAGAYQDCIVNFDVNGPGQSVISEWDNVRGQLNAEMNEREIKARDWENALGNARWYLYNRPDSMSAGYAIGFQTAGRGKEMIMHQMRGAHITGELVIRSFLLLQEMCNVVQDGVEIGAPESTSEEGKDDRVFAAALANRAWIDWRRPEMLAQGITWDTAMREQRGELTKQTQMLNGIVSRFLLTQAEKADMPATAPRWQVDRELA